MKAFLSKSVLDYFAFFKIGREQRLLLRSICESIDPLIEKAQFPAKAVGGRRFFLYQRIFVSH